LKSLVKPDKGWKERYKYIDQNEEKNEGINSKSNIMLQVPKKMDRNMTSLDSYSSIEL